MALHVLVTQGYTNKQLNIPKRAYNTKVLELTRINNESQKWSTEIDRIGDTCKIISLSAKCDINTEIEKIQLILNNTVALDVPGTILKIASGESEYSDSIKHWPFHYDSFLELPLPIGNLHFTCVIFRVFFTDTVQSVDVCIDYQYVDFDERRSIIENPLVMIQQIENDSVNVQQFNNTKICLLLEGNYLSKGFFIETDTDTPISNIQECTLSIHGHTYIELYKPYILKYCKFINNNLLWVPFKRECDIWNLDKKSYDGAINMARIDNLKLELLFSKVPSKISILPVSLNCIRIHNGIAELVCHSFSLRNCTKQITEPIHRPLNPDKSMCPILYDEIKGEYYSCHVCNTNFSKVALDTCFKKSNDSTCPYCRTVWTNFIVYYV